LGKVVFGGKPLRELLIEAVRYGDRPDVRARLTKVVENAFDREQLVNLMEERALAHDVMDASRVRRIREDMERADARRLQPHYIQSFFIEAFRQLGGAARQRETGRFEITHVPAPIRNRDRLIGMREPVLSRYERVVFEKELVNPPGQSLAAFLCPGHPLLDATVDLVLERHRDLLKRGAVLVDERDPGNQSRVLFFLEHAIHDATLTRSGERRTVSKQVLYIEMNSDGAVRHLHYAPYLDYRPLRYGEADVNAILALPECAWITRGLEQKAQGYAVTAVVPEHLNEVKTRRLELIAKIEAAVKDRLTKEINYWDHRAQQLRLDEQAGKPNARLNWQEAEKRADGLQTRLQKRLEELKLEAQIFPLPPVVLGGVVIIPQGLLARVAPQTAPALTGNTEENNATAARARAVVMEIEARLGFVPVDRETDKLGYDIESKIPGTGKLRFIEVKGRMAGADTVTVTRNEILYSLNKPDDFILAIVEFDGDQPPRPHYIRRPFQKDVEFAVTSVNYNMADLLARAEEPA